MKIQEKYLLISSYWESFLLLLLSICTLLLFQYLNTIHPYYFIDEVFHVPQTLRYCAGNFTEWDPKITTLPGLYIITSTVLSPLNLCNLYHIRLTNLCAIFFNYFLFYNIIMQIQKSDKINWVQLATVYNLILFPPLFFWFFLYYTDIVSVTMILWLILMHLRKNFKTAAFAGLLAVLIRQTNIIWVACLTVEHGLDLLENKTPQPVHHKCKNNINQTQLLWNNLLIEVCKGPVSFLKYSARILYDLSPYVLVGLTFLAFLIWNGGIVVGDHSAHKPTIHIPQILYFSIFSCAFSWPYMLPHILPFLAFVKKHWLLLSCLLAFLTVVVHCNTLVHPYVLADNRHYIFYVWNKLMGRYVILRYLLIPVYCFTIYTIFANMSHLRVMTRINYFCCICLVLIPQLLLEPRYFIIPYILCRLNIQEPEKWQIAMESLTTMSVNFAQFFIFANKLFYWDDQLDPQRIAW